MLLSMVHYCVALAACCAMELNAVLGLQNADGSLLDGNFDMWTQLHLDGTSGMMVGIVKDAKGSPSPMMMSMSVASYVQYTMMEDDDKLEYLNGEAYQHMEWALSGYRISDMSDDGFSIAQMVQDVVLERPEVPLLEPKMPSQRHKRRRLRPIHFAYNPDLDDECFYQNVLFGLGLPTDKLHVCALRHHLASLWEAMPGQVELVACAEQLTSAQYLRGIRTKMWGGSPERELLTVRYDIGFCIINEYRQVEFENQGKVKFVLLRYAGHFYFLKRNVCSGCVCAPVRRSCRAGMPLKLITKEGDMSIEVPSEPDSGEDNAEPTRQAPSPPRARSPLQRRKRQRTSPDRRASEPDQSQQRQCKKDDATGQSDGEQKEGKSKAGALHKHPLDVHADLSMLKPGDKPANQHHVQHAIAQHDEQPATWDDLTDKGPWIYHFPKEGSMRLLCRKRMGTGHVQAAGHLKKFAQYKACTPAEREEWLDTTRLNLGCWSPKADEKWIQQKDGYPWCPLCDATATVSRLQSQGHRAEVGASEFNLEHTKHIIASIRQAEAREAAKTTTGSSSSSVQRAGMPPGLLALPQQDWTNISIYRADYPAWRQIRYGTAGYWSYELHVGVTGREIKQKIGTDLHVKQARIQLWDEEGYEVADEQDCLLSLKIRPRTESQSQTIVSRVTHAPLAKGRVVLQLHRLKQKLKALSARVRRLEASVRMDARDVRRGRYCRAGAIHQYLVPPTPSYPWIPDVLIYIHGLPEITEMTVPQGTTLIQVKHWLQLHGWNLGPVVTRKMLRLKDNALLFTYDHLTFRSASYMGGAQRAGAPKGLAPWESSTSTEGITNVAKITLDDKEVTVVPADSLHQGTQGAVFSTFTTWLRHAELRESEELIWKFPGTCTSLLKKHGVEDEHTAARQMLLRQPGADAPLRRNVTTLYRGKRTLSLDKGLECELLLELDPRWVVQDTLRLVQQDWKVQAPTLASSALQRTLTQADLFAYRQPTPTNPCWTARLYLSQEQALKLLATSGQRSLFVRPVRTDAEEWKSLWTIVWSNLPHVMEGNLLSVILKHAEQHAGHVGIARAYRNLGLRVPWTTVKPARDCLRPADHALSEYNRALRDDKTFKISGVPRGALARKLGLRARLQAGLLSHKPAFRLSQDGRTNGGQLRPLCQRT